MKGKKPLNMDGFFINTKRKRTCGIDRKSSLFNGGAEQDRTVDLLNAIQEKKHFFMFPNVSKCAN
jgi:hypothetical protein